MSRLVLVDTADQLPGLLPLHAWSALMSSELVVVGSADHPFVPHLDAAELRFIVLPEAGEASLVGADLLAGVSPERKAQAQHMVDLAEQHGEVVYLFGPGDDEGFTRTMGMEAASSGVEVEIVYFGVASKGLELLRLVEVETRLRGPGGCPWDREQDHHSLARYAVEELYELLEAIESGEEAAIREELGDVLLQVVFHAQIAEDAGAYTIDDVARDIADKLVRRHPHVFAEAEDMSPDEVKVRWDALKAAEKPEREGIFDGIPVAQPALGYVEKLQHRAAKAGFDWTADDDAAERIHLEVEELMAAEGREEQAKELGDLLMSVVGLARRLGADPELALRGAAGRFRARFEHMAGAADRPLAELSRDEWLGLWEQAKTVAR